MTSISWWRSWHGAPMDHKWPVIAAKANVKVGIVSAVAWALFDHASQHKERGCVSGFDTEVYAIYSGFPEDEIEAVIKAMENKGIITDDHLVNWEKRQPQREDDSRERVAQWRDRQRIVTQNNAEISPDKDKDKDNRIKEEEYTYSETSQLQKTFCDITGMPTFPSSSMTEDLRRLEILYSIHGPKTADYCKPFYQEWLKRKYSKTNTSWLDWAIANQIPIARGTKSTNQDFKEGKTADDRRRYTEGEYADAINRD